MSLRKAYVVGAGPNGLCAAVTLARAGVEVVVLEARERPGGGASSEALTLPGFVHDVCSAVHPLAAGSPALRALALEKFGLRWIQPPAPLAHPFDDGTAAVLERSLEETAAGLGRDGRTYARLAGPLSKRWDELAPDLLAPLHAPRSPALLARFALLAAWPASWTARAAFRSRDARALFAGLAGHSVLPLSAAASSAVGWVLALAGHAVGWPLSEGGSQRLADALAALLAQLGGRLELGRRVSSLGELSGADAVLCDVSPRRLAALAGERLPARFRRALEDYRYGPGVFKLDWALDGPIPWRAAACARAGTVHLGGTLEELEDSERAASEGRVCGRPFVLLSQPSLFDASRAPAGRHTAWAYCHVPAGCGEDLTSRIEAQVERFAPGFRKLILARRATGPADFERRNPNLVGGDITGGAQDLRQLFRRPTWRGCRTPARGLYLCSASTPPGGGVHGMCGWHAAQAALADLR